MDIKIILDHLTIRKTNWNDLKKEEKEGYNPYLINLWLSHAPGYIEIINQVQSYQVPNRDHYNFYLQVLPKKKLFLNWLKPKSKKYNKDVISRIATFYSCSTREINDSIELFEEKEIIRILKNTGLLEKDIKKLLK